MSALIKKELGIESGSGMPDKDKVGNMAIEDAIKVAQMKKDSLLVNDLKAAVKCVVGSANSLGVLVEGKIATDTCRDIDDGKYDKEIGAGKTEVDAEKRAVLKEQLEAMRQKYSKVLEKIKKDAEDKKAAAEGAAAEKKEEPAKEPAKKEPAKK